MTLYGLPPQKIAEIIILVSGTILVIFKHIFFFYAFFLREFPPKHRKLLEVFGCRHFNTLENNRIALAIYSEFCSRPYAQFFSDSLRYYNLPFLGSCCYLNFFFCHSNHLVKLFYFLT